MRALLFILVAGLLSLNATCADAEQREWRVPFPVVPKGKGDVCVRDTAFMRVNHMDLLLHQRDETVYKGIRPKKTALTECLACHAVKGDDGKPVTNKDPRFFCRECHDYTAVKIDCFACHSSVPEEDGP